MKTASAIRRRIVAQIATNRWCGHLNEGECRSSDASIPSRASVADRRAGSREPRRCVRSYTFARPRARAHSETCRWSRSPRRLQWSDRHAARHLELDPARSLTARPRLARSGDSARVPESRASSRDTCFLSHWARGDHTAGPRLVFSNRNWIPTASVNSPMMPPSASISRTR